MDSHEIDAATPSSPASQRPSSPSDVARPAAPASTAPATVVAPTTPTTSAESEDFSAPPAPTIHVALPAVSANAVREALSILSALPERIEAQDRLDEEHAQLQRSFREQRSRTLDLERELAGAYAAAAPFVQHVQRRYELLHHQYQEASQRSAEFQSALVDRQAESTELLALRDRLRTIEQDHAAKTDQLQASIQDLTTKLATATRPQTRSAPRLARQLVALQSVLAEAKVARDRAIHALQLTGPDLLQLGSLRRSLTQSEQRVTDLEEKHQDLQVQLDQQIATSRRQLSRVLAEADTSRDRLKQLESDLVISAAELKPVTAARDRAVVELQSAQSQAAGARSSIARLEGQVNTLQTDRAFVASLERGVEELRDALHASRSSCAQVEKTRDLAERECADIRSRVAGLASVLQPGSFSAASPSIPGSVSTKATSRVKRPRSRSHSRSASQRSPRSSTSRAPRGSVSANQPASRNKISPPTPLTTDRHSSRAGRPGPAWQATKRRPSVAPRSTQQPPLGRRRLQVSSSSSSSESSSGDDILLSALASSRSEARRRSPVRGSDGGSATQPISIDLAGSSPGSSSAGSSGSIGPSAPHPPPHSGDAIPSAAGNSPSESSDESGDEGDRVPAARAVELKSRSGRPGSAKSKPSAHFNQLLSTTDLAHLAPTVVPRDEWIPGYYGRMDFSGVDVAPWDASSLSQISVLELDIEILFHQLSQPKGWIFPSPELSADSCQWFPELLTEANIKALYETEPWMVLDSMVSPLSFDLEGWFEVLYHKYAEFEIEHLQSWWESAHALPFERDGPYLTALWQQRKQHRSRLGARWKRFLRFVLQGIVEGRCDLDILLDPLFLQYPRKGERRTWYPGLGYSKSPPDLISALKLTDRADPWRNQFRSNIQDHPSSRLDRLGDKYALLKTH